MLGDAGEHVAEIGEGLDPVQPGRLDQRVDNGRVLAAGVGTGEQEVLAVMQISA